MSTELPIVCLWCQQRFTDEAMADHVIAGCDDSPKDQELRLLREVEKAARELRIALKHPTTKVSTCDAAADYIYSATATDKALSALDSFRAKAKESLDPQRTARRGEGE